MVNKYNFNLLLLGNLSEKSKSEDVPLENQDKQVSPPDRIINNLINYSKSLFVYDLKSSRHTVIMN